MSGPVQREIDQRERAVGHAALRTLVKQFSDPFAFIRELVQNSLDSGTPSIDVWTTYHPSDPYRGVCEIHVDDFGTGMDELIIDTKLTRLFSSTKEDDLTNIGKFGIGFVSVFAIAPQGVLIKTARGGEHWEVFFNEDRSFEKTHLEEPSEGTQITIFKTIRLDEYQTIVQNVRGTLDFWCKHAEKSIYFWDALKSDPGNEPEPPKRRRKQLKVKKELINRPLSIQGFLPTTVRHGDTEIALAFSNQNLYGFYNQGLTLTESSGDEVISDYVPFFGQIAFKVKSPYLEHTLTRDNIRRDDNYRKAMALVVDAARLTLVRKLVDHIEALAQKPTLNDSERTEYLEALRWLFSLPRALDPTFGFNEQLKDVLHNLASLAVGGESEPDLDEKSINASKRRLFRGCHGGSYNIGELKQAIKMTYGRIVIAERACDLTAELHQNDRAVLLAPFGPESREFFHQHVTGTPAPQETAPRVNRIDGQYYFYEIISKREFGRERMMFFDRLYEVLAKLDLPMGTLYPVNFLGDDPDNTKLIGFECQRGVIDTNLPLDETDPKRPIYVNVGAAAFEQLRSVFRESPDLATSILLRQVISQSVSDSTFAKKLYADLWGALS